MAYHAPIQVRFRDIDPLHHVSHTEYVTYVQQARLEFQRDTLALTDTPLDTVVVHLEIDYHDQITVDDDVAVTLEVTSIGETSYTTAFEITADDRTAASGASVQVVVDPSEDGPVPIPPWLADRLATHEPDH